MIAIAAREAKEHFGKLMDTVQREPVTIEKHGRPVAVVISQTEYDQMKLEHLRAKLAVGEAQLDRGESITISSKEESHNHFESLKKRGRVRAEERNK